MSTTKISNVRLRYHRNGVAGEGFFLVAFAIGRGKSRQDLLATVFEEPGCCAVIDPADLASRWRGDDFEPALRAAIEQQMAAGDSAFNRGKACPSGFVRSDTP